jgi:hypothetical protein
MYIKEEFKLSNLQVLHHAFHYDGQWYGILGTKYTPDVVPLDEKLIGSYKTPTEKVPDLEILLTGGSDVGRVNKRANIQNGVILIPSAMAALRSIALSEGVVCLKAIRTFFREAIQSNSTPHLRTGDSGLPEEIATLEKYAETVLQWMYLAVKPNCRAVTAFKASTRADATSNAVSRGCQILRGYATPVAPDDELAQDDDTLANEDKADEISEDSRPNPLQRALGGRDFHAIDAQRKADQARKNAKRA